MRLFLLIFGFWIFGCTASGSFEAEADVDVGIGGEVLSGDGDGDVLGDGDGDAASGGTGGLDGGTGGSDGAGGNAPVDGTGGDVLGGSDRCYPQWDPAVVYEAGARAQVDERIYERCGEGESEGETPYHYNNLNPQVCANTWRWVADCASLRCEDAIEWLAEDMYLQFYPPLTLGALFLYEGDVYELQEWDYEYGEMWNMEFPTHCPPNPAPGELDDWGNSCEDQIHGTFGLAPQCL